MPALLIKMDTSPTSLRILSAISFMDVRLVTSHLKFYIFFYQLHAVSRTQQGKQREPSAKTFRSLVSAEQGKNSAPRFASTPVRKNRNIHFNKYFISSSGDRTHNQSVLQSHFVPLRHDWSLLYIVFKTIE